jgi:uncharacterized protein (TIGR02145 family)
MKLNLHKMRLLVLGLLVFSCFGLTQDRQIIDVRGGRKYTQLELGDRIWIKENMKYLFKSKNQDDSLSLQFPDYYEKYGAYYNFRSAKNACPDGYHIPNVQEWKKLISELNGIENSRMGKTVPINELNRFGLLLGGMGRADTVLLSNVMGYYWTSSDTLKPYFKEPDIGNQRHLIGIHVWSSGGKDSINVEPTYLLAKTYESNTLMSCKCVK